MVWDRACMDASAAPAGVLCTRDGSAASFFRSGRVANIGAGCGPFCRNSALVTIANVAIVPMVRPTNSRGWRLTASAILPGPPNVSLREDRLRTFLHPVINHRTNNALALRRKPDWIVCAPISFAANRQSHRHAGSFAKPAAYLNVAVVQTDQPFDDGKAKPGAVLAAIVGRIRLEERLAQARQIGFTNTDARILDRDGKVRSIAQGADSHLAAVRRGLDGVGNEVDEDLIERAPVGRHFRKPRR